MVKTLPVLKMVYLMCVQYNSIFEFIYSYSILKHALFDQLEKGTTELCSKAQYTYDFSGLEYYLVILLNSFYDLTVNHC